MRCIADGGHSAKGDDCLLEVLTGLRPYITAIYRYSGQNNIFSKPYIITYLVKILIIKQGRITTIKDTLGPGILSTIERLSSS